jgi:hypothetical protein
MESDSNKAERERERVKSTTAFRYTLHAKLLFPDLRTDENAAVLLLLECGHRNEPA